MSSVHENHRHTNAASAAPEKHDLGILGALLHVIGDAVNNIGVIISALVIWLAKYDGRHYADPGVSIGIAILILVSAIPLGESSGTKELILSDTLLTADGWLNSSKQRHNFAWEYTPWCRSRRCST